MRGVASLGNFPYYLVSNNPAVKTIADFTDKDRIAAAGGRRLGAVAHAAARRRPSCGATRSSTRLDKMQVALPHPEATAAIIKGGTEITAHFGNPPFQDQELAGNPKAHIVLNCYDVLGGPASATVLYATEKFRDDNPKTYAPSSPRWPRRRSSSRPIPRQAADIYLSVDQAQDRPRAAAEDHQEPRGASSS